MSAAKGQMTCLMVVIAILLISSCAEVGIAPFPVGRIYEADYKSKVCGEWHIYGRDEKIYFKHVADHALSKCDGVFGFQAEEIGKVRNWINDTIQTGKRRCK